MTTPIKLRLLIVSIFILLLPNNIIASSKVLLVHSYHKGFEWSDNLEKGFRKALGLNSEKKIIDTDNYNDIDLKVFWMDTKRNNSEQYKNKVALEAKGIIESWEPDIVVTSDDNASKYLTKPYYKDSEIPFVFCGVNWDASAYGFPYSNVTGMVEVDPVLETINILKKFTSGSRIGYLGADNISNQVKPSFHKKVLGINYIEGQLVSDFASWKHEYLRMQDVLDILIIFNPIGVTGWDENEAYEFVLNNTKIPSGNLEEYTRYFALIGRVKLSEEQGWWAGKTALNILAGVLPSDIPIAKNKKSKVYLNMPLANKLGIIFPVELFEQSEMIDKKRVD